MYPVLNKLYVLIKQYSEPFLYQLYSDGNHSYTSNSYSTEIINKTACEILECCNGISTIEDITNILSERYNENYDKVFVIVNNFLLVSEQKKIIYFINSPQLNHINVCGSYDIITPVNVTFEITKACPLKCKHCFNNSGNEKINELDKKDIMVVLEKMKNIGVQKICITGGEPTTRKDFIEIIKYCSMNFISVAINSNGYYIDAKIAKEISKYKNIMIQISLDGMVENHNFIRGHAESFSRATNAIKFLTQNNIIVTVATTINEKNFCDIEEVTKLSKSLGAYQISFAKTMNLGRAKTNEIADSIDLAKLIKKVGSLSAKYTDEKFFVLDPTQDENARFSNENPSYCGAGVTQICVKENGDVTPCATIPYIYGNLFKQDVKHIFSPTKVEIFKKLIRPGAYYCNGCMEESICLGCNATALEAKNEECSWRKANTLPISFIENLKHYG